MRFIFFTLFLLIQATPGSANSSGIGGACFADAINLCTLNCPDDIPRPWAKKNDAGILSPCCPPGMDRVAPPTHNAAYSLTSPQEKYNPGSIVTLSLDVLKKDAKYLGLLLYAVQDDGREIRVGTWTFPKAGSPKFWTPPTCDKKVVMHKHAGVKHIHHTFDFVAPPVGTGQIRFRVLIKHGETNGGSFFWPQTDLTMKEGPSQVSPVWIRGDFGQSCTAACGDKGLSCDGQAINDAIASKGTAQFNSASKFVPCLRPHISNNGKSCDLGNSPLVSSDDGFCFYRDDELCPQKNICKSKTSKSRRRTCACMPTPASTTASTTTKADTTTKENTAKTTTKMTLKPTDKTTSKATTEAETTKTVFRTTTSSTTIADSTKATTKIDTTKKSSTRTTTAITSKTDSITTTKPNPTPSTKTKRSPTTMATTSITERPPSTGMSTSDIDKSIDDTTSLRVGHSTTTTVDGIENAISDMATHELIGYPAAALVLWINVCM